MKIALYPEFTLNKIENPNQFYAVPLIGFLAKIILLIPVGIELVFLGLFQLLVTFINSWVVLFTGKYWQFAYQYTLGFLRLSTKVTLYFYGLTDSYPWFDFTIKDDYKIEMDCPTQSNRLFAFPVLGGLARIILLIPYLIFNQVLSYGAGVGVFFSFYRVLFKKTYPESTFEFAKDAVRIDLATNLYILGLSDIYPSFAISMNHQTIKIFLIIAGTALSVGNYKVDNSHQSTQPKQIELQDTTAYTY
jgi:hypothetical protein